MIIVKNRELLIPNNERYIGTTYDNDTENRVFQVPRFSQRGVDLANLTFRLDIQYANESYDTVVLDKEVGEAFVILIWRITSSTLQVPGTLYIGLRAIDDEATVKWSSFSAAMYAERHLNTPGNYGGSLTEIEQMEQDHVYMKGVVDELKSHLDYTHEAEAWAIGKKDGEDVPSTDETYHNNSKYYSNQASTKATQAANSATAAANSATQAAETVSDTNTRFNNALAAVTSETEVIDARVGADGTQYTVLKNRLDAEHNQLKNAIDYDVVNPVNWLDLDATADGILKANGTVEASTTYYYTDFIRVKPGDQVRTYYNTSRMYRANTCAYDIDKTVVPSAGSDSAWRDEYTVPNGIYYVRFTFQKIYFSKAMVTINTEPTAYAAYFEPYIVYNRDILTAETKKKVDGLPTALADVTVKGTNLVPIADYGVGAYINQNGAITFYPNYTTYSYAIMPVKPHTRYFVNNEPMWWILTDDNDTILQSGSRFAPNTKKYIDTGEATKFYYTASNAAWNQGVIIAEGLTGTKYNLQKPGFLNGLNQLMFDSWYAMALPKNSRIRFTKDLTEKFYYINMLSLPKKNTLLFSINGYETYEPDGVLINPPTAGNWNNYLFTVYDDNLSIVEQNVNGMFGSTSNDNVQDCSVLLLGDSTIAHGYIGQDLIDDFASRGKTVTLLGTRGNGNNKNEGRSGWSAHQYCTVASSGNVSNPFYNPNTAQFDFSYYMTNQGYESVDFVVIQLGINDLYNVALSAGKEAIATLINDMLTIIQSIKSFNANQKILLNLPTPCTSDITKVPSVTQKFIRAKFIYYNAMMQVIHTGVSDVRTSHCHLILDPATDISDNIHPNVNGYQKMALEILSQINCWQNGN